METIIAPGIIELQDNTNCSFVETRSRLPILVRITETVFYMRCFEVYYIDILDQKISFTYPK